MISAFESLRRHAPRVVQLAAVATAIGVSSPALAVTDVVWWHAMQGELETLQKGRPQYANDAAGLIAASHVIAVEFATIAAANQYWR